MTSTPLLTVILPAYDEEGVVGSTIARIREVVDTHPEMRGRTEIVVVSDGSADGTFDEAAKELAEGPGGTVVQLVKNVGSHGAIRCGLTHAAGELVAIMAADGQDPPETLPDLVAAFRPGIDVVWGARTSRAKDPLATRGLARGYYWLFRKLTGLDYPPSGLDFVALSRPAIDAVLAHQERNTSVFLTIFNLGFGQATVPYERGERTAGTSHWTMRKRLKLAGDMLTAFSATPIRLVSAAGIVVGLVGLVFGLFTVVRGLVTEVPVPGWASLMVVTSLMGGLLLVAVSLLGEYVWRTLDEVRRRPLYLEARHQEIRPQGDDHQG